MRIRVAPNGVNAWLVCKILGHREGVLVIRGGWLERVCARCGALDP